MAAEQHVESEENSEKGIKRKREPSVLDNFTKLTHNKEKIRVKNGVDLLKRLTENDSAEKSGDELKYALGRLVRGLGSSNINAKTGFFTALVGLLNLKSITISDIFEHVSKELHKGGSNSKSENADVSSGQILVAGAILRSNLYENSENADKIKVIQLLLNAGKERTYLTLAAYKFLSDLFQKIDSNEFEKNVFPLIKPELSKLWDEQNLDSLYLLLKIQECFPQNLHSKFLKNNLGSELLCEQSLVNLCNILTTIPRVVALRHPVFDLFIKKILESDLIEQFFDKLDKILSRYSRNKFFVATKILTGVLENLNDPSLIPDILTKNYIQQMISMYKNSVGRQKDKEFQEITQKLFAVLLNCLKKDCVKSKTKIKVLKKLLFFPGIFVFEKITKNKLVQNVTATLNGEGVKKLGGIYRDVILAVNDRVVNENLSEKWWNSDRIYASHLLVKLINHVSIQEENDWKIEQLVFLGKLGLLNQSEVGHELADSFRDTFYSALDLKLTKLESLRLILSKVVDEFDQIIVEDHFQTVLRNPLEENKEIWKQTVTLAKKLEDKSKKKNVVFHILFLHLGLQLFNDSKLASSSLKELFSCYERTKKPKTEESDEDPLWIEVVIDLFLNLLSHNSHLLRTVINCVFPHLCKYMNPVAIHQILSVLDPKNESNPLSKPGEESEEEDEETDEENEDESDESSVEDEEEDNISDKLRMALHQALGAGDSDAESVDLDQLDEEEGEKLNEALGQAFKQFKPNLGRSKKQKKDEEALTHFRIRALDLVEIYLNSNPSMLLTLEIMLPLLQLLEFCIKDDHQKPLEARVNACLKKLTSLKKFSECDVTEEVLVDLLNSLLDKGAGSAIVIQEMGEKISDCCIFVVTCSQILKNSEANETLKKSKRKDRVSLLMRDNLEAFFTRSSSVPYVLFKNLLQLNWPGIFTLIPTLTGFIFAPSVRPFRRTQAVELVKIFLHNQRLLSTHSDEISDFVNFLRDCVDFFREFSHNPKERKVKEKFLSSLFELLTTVKASLLGKKFDGWALLGDAVRDCRSKVSFSRNTKLAFNKFCNSLGISTVVEKQSHVVKLNVKEDDDDDDDNDEEVESKQEKKKKKKMNKEKLKLKKQTKELRLLSLSEGMKSKRKLEAEAEKGSKKLKVKLNSLSI